MNQILTNLLICTSEGVLRVEGERPLLKETVLFADGDLHTTLKDHDEVIGWFTPLVKEERSLLLR